MRVRRYGIPGKRLANAFRAGAVFAVVAVLLGNAGLPAMAKPPLYPDLITMAPSGLYMDRSSNGHYLLRFANTAANVGGRLEISVDSMGSKVIYQNIYDQAVGGNRVVRQQVHSDLIYHPQHNHFHFAGFAQYELLKKNKAGAFDVTQRAGSKTTFCILDTVRVNSSGPTYPTYNTCGALRQGMSAGWGDTYVAALFDQWIDVGIANLTDGQYAIRSTADPDNRIFETNDFNNVGMTYFSIANGRVSSVVNPATCTAVAAAAGTSAVGDPAATQVGSVARVSCERFQAGETVDLYWGSVNTDVRATVTATSSGAVTAFLETPPSSIGVHYWIAKGRSSGIQAAAIVNTIPTIKLEPVRGEVGTKTRATLRGFSAGEQIDVSFYKNGSVVSSTSSATASGSGSGTVEFPVPVAPYGVHDVVAIGKDSGARASTTFITDPSIDLSTGQADTGDSVGVALRGFVPGEHVTVSFGSSKINVGDFVPSHSGSTTASSSSFVVPEVASGDYQVSARGDISGVVATTSLEVDADDSSTDPTGTPTETSPPPTETTVATSTSTPEATATETVVNGSPVANAGVDQAVVDVDSSSQESVQLDGSASIDPDNDGLVASWTLDGQEIATELNPLVDLAVGEHTLTLTVTDTFGAASSDEVVVTVTSPDPPPNTPTP